MWNNDVCLASGVRLLCFADVKGVHEAGQQILRDEGHTGLDHVSAHEEVRLVVLCDGLVPFQDGVRPGSQTSDDCENVLKVRLLGQLILHCEVIHDLMESPVVGTSGLSAA